MQRDFFQRVPVQTFKRRALERRTHIALAERLRVETTRTGWFFTHIANGEHRSKATGALLKRMGMRRGVFDFLLINPTGAHHWLELKRGLEPLSDEQDAFAAMLRACGVPYYVARSYDAAAKQLKTWGAI